MITTQTPAVGFEVASVKRSLPLTGSMRVNSGRREGDRWRADNATLRMLLLAAYAVEFPTDGQIGGGPSWMDSDRFDIMASLRPSATADEVRAMVRTLLVERFQLRTHTERRELSTYSLVLARADGRLGPAMKPLTVDCDALRAARAKGQTPTGSVCSISVSPGSQVTEVNTSGLNVAGLTDLLSRVSGRPVTNGTGLSGWFAFTLRFANEPGATALGGGPPQAVSLDAVDAPSLQSAVVDQLGLKLESRREQVDVLVIDGASPPTEN
ncbi:MAG TPA: TIGR03435 family protein [Vicinamibacterales bacterium]|nr:TIGR03435 family protein [Vicinamibacterales bacterium]